MEKDRLKDIFNNIREDSPSMAFERKLMQEIRHKQNLIEKKQQRITLICLATVITTLIIGIIITFNYFGLEIKPHSLTNKITLSEIVNQYSIYFMIPTISLFLFSIDTLIRTQMKKREHKQ